MQAAAIVEKLSRTRRAAALCVLLLTLASCVSSNLANWPDSIPPQSVFAELYAADSENQNRQTQTEYLQWTLSFYQGNLAYQSGWQDISGYVLPAPSDSQREELLVQLRSLGIAIGGEWAKHNDVRKVDTRMLSLWGSTIQLAPNFDKQQETVQVIAQDVEQLLDGMLMKDDIVDARYATLLGLELFEGF